MVVLFLKDYLGRSESHGFKDARGGTGVFGFRKISEKTNSLRNKGAKGKL